MALTTMPFRAFAMAVYHDTGEIFFWAADTFCANESHGYSCSKTPPFWCDTYIPEYATDNNVRMALHHFQNLVKVACEDTDNMMFSYVQDVITDVSDRVISVECLPGYIHPNTGHYDQYKCMPDPKKTDEYRDAEYQKFMHFDTNSSALSAADKAALEQERKFQSSGMLADTPKSEPAKPSLSKKPSTSSPKPTSAKGGGAGAGAAKVVKAPPKPTTNNNNNVYTAQENKLPAEANTAAASSAVAAPYAAVNSTVAKAPLEHIDPLKANINAPKPEAVSAEFTKKDVEKLYTNLPEEQEAKKACEKKEKGKWVVNGKTSTCVCPNQADGYFFDKNILKCINQDNSEEVAQSILDSIPSLTPGDSITVKKSLMNTSDIRSAITQWESKCREVATSRKYMGAEANIQNNNKSPNSTITCLIQSCKNPEMYQLNSSKTACEQPSMSGEQASQNNCLAEGGEWKTKEKTCNCKGGRVWKPDTQTCVTEQMSDDEKQMIANCDGTWDSNKKVCNCHADKMAWSKSHQSCIDINDVDVSEIPQNKCGTVLPDTGWDSSTGVCVKLNENGCVGNDKKCNKSATKAQTKLEKSMEKDINTLTKAFFDTVKKIVKACEKDNGSFKDGECIQKPTEEQPAETNNTNNKRTSGAKAGKGKKK